MLTDVLLDGIELGDMLKRLARNGRRARSSKFVEVAPHMRPAECELNTATFSELDNLQLIRNSAGPQISARVGAGYVHEKLVHESKTGKAAAGQSMLAGLPDSLMVGNVMIPIPSGVQVWLTKFADTISSAVSPTSFSESERLNR
ncbi:hypothetical protein ABIF86_000294 [Bradyrhizobium japonicum]